MVRALTGTLRSGEIRRRLLDRPDELSERRLDLLEIRSNGARGGMERPLSVVGLAASAKRELGFVHFRHCLNKFGQPSRVAEAEDEHTRGQRIKRTRVPDSGFRWKPAGGAIHGIARGHADGFVEDQ